MSDRSLYGLVKSFGLMEFFCGQFAEVAGCWHDWGSLAQLVIFDVFGRSKVLQQAELALQIYGRIVWSQKQVICENIIMYNMQHLWLILSVYLALMSRQLEYQD